MRSLVLGTAGHIDHGKTALVRALTGVDTDRLQEEKERGITIDLGFAELAEDGLALGVVDVPGHEGFVRNMLAGATGMDAVVLVVAADEGIMPQTREHLAIVTLLGVRRLVVALTKCDLVEDAWLELVREEVADLLDGGPWADAPVVATAAPTGAGLDDLREALRRVAAVAEEEDDDDDLAFLPVDRVFTVTGTGTVVTGTLWSGTLATGQRVRLLPGDVEARIRGVEVHGKAASSSSAGRRTALALAGQAVDRERARRGRVVVADDAWRSTHMLTARLRLLPDTAWSLAHNQRVHVHLGTAEVAARCVLLEGREALGPGEDGWGQLRLEAPVVARAREPFVIRSWSPVTTIGGGRVAEPDPPKRKEVRSRTGALLAAVLDGEAADAVAAAVELAGAEGVDAARLPVLTGLGPGAVRRALAGAEGAGQGTAPVERGGRVHTAARVQAARAAVERCVDDWHAREPLRPGAPLEAVRSAPEGAPATLVDDILSELVAEGRLRIVDGAAARPDFEPVLGAEGEALRDRIAALYRAAGLQPPTVSELPAPVGGHPDLWPLLRILENRGDLVRLEEGLFVWAETLREAEARMRMELGGRSGLGPADFRDVIPVTRKHLIPILGHFDRSGATVRTGDVRAVAAG